MAYILAMVIACAILAFAITAARSQYFNFDEAVALNVSNTLASHGVYATELNGGYIRYDPIATSGPTVIVPLAFAIRTFGTAPGVVRATLVISFIIYLAIAFGAVKRIFGNFVALAFLIVLTTTPLALWLGLSALGEVPAICLGLFALALLGRADDGVKRSRLFLAVGGLSLALAILAKEIMMLVAIAGMAVVAIEFLKSKTRRRAIQRAIAILFGLGIVFGWRGYQYLAMRLSTPDEFRKWLAIVKDIRNLHGTQTAYRPLSHTRQAWELAYELFAPYLLGFAVGLLAIWLLRYLFKLSLRWIDWESSAQKTIFAAAIIWCVWYFFISGPEANNRHFMIGLAFIELLALHFAHQLWSFTQKKLESLPDGVAPAPNGKIAVWTTYAVAGLVIGLMVWGVWRGISYNREFYIASKRQLQSQLRVAKWMESNVPTNSAISGWGWYVPWHIAFLANRTPAKANIYTASLSGMTDWLVIPPEIADEGPDKKRQSFLERQGHLEFSDGGYEVYRVSHRPEDEPTTTAQLRTVLTRVKKWKAEGHNYSELNPNRAIADDLIPAEMIIHNKLQNLFGGPVDITAAPANNVMPYTFLLLFSGVPDEDCVNLAFPPNDDFLVYAGDYRRIASSLEHAKLLCTTGNMWFVAR
jgi:hypothetical protein